MHRRLLLGYHHILLLLQLLLLGNDGGEFRQVSPSVAHNLLWHSGQLTFINGALCLLDLVYEELDVVGVICSLRIFEETL